MPRTEKLERKKKTLVELVGIHSLFVCWNILNGEVEISQCHSTNKIILLQCSLSSPHPQTQTDTYEYVLAVW